MTFDQNSLNTKVGSALTNVLKSHEFFWNFKNSILQSCKGLQAESFGFFKKGFWFRYRKSWGFDPMPCLSQKNATVKNSSKSMMSVVGDCSAEAE